jgi:hypothetical protein
VFLAVCVLAVLVAVTVFSVVRPGWQAVAVTAAVAGLWAWLDKPMEGWTVVRLTHGHGVTIGDTAGVLAVLIAVAFWVAST